MRKIFSLILTLSLLMLATSSDAGPRGRMGGGFNRGLVLRQAQTTTAATTSIIPRVLELWYGTISTPQLPSVCTDNDYVETALVYARTTDTSTKITYNDTGCGVDPGSPNTNHWSLAAGTYRITLTAHQTNNTSSDTCSMWLYGDTGGATVINSAKTGGVGAQGSTVFLLAGGAYSLYPWSDTCTGDEADIQVMIMIERLLVN